ncbi:hypothetical protein BGX34_009480 [Mortierella sp. NVP85]|nr:hypothetical protein BGX34_009480 [Mortierella sp. NVP85]
MSYRRLLTALLLASTLCSSPFSAAAPIATLSHATTCASSDHGAFWVIGAENNGLTFVKSKGPLVLRPSKTQRSLSGFTGGKCLEVSPTTVYYITDHFQGFLTLTSDTSGEWTDLQAPPKSDLDVTRLNPKRLALASAEANTAVVVAAIDTRIVKWTTSGKVEGLVNIADLSDKNAVSLLVSIPSSRVLVPLSAADGVALVGKAAADKVDISWYFRDPKKVNFNRTITTASGSFDKSVFVVDERTVTLIDPSGVNIVPIPIGGGAPGGPGPNGATSGGGSTPDSLPSPSSDPENTNQLPVIIGSIVGALAIVALFALFIIARKRSHQGRPLFGKKQKDLFPLKKDEAMMPLGLYHQERGLPELPQFDHNLERSFADGHGYNQEKNYYNTAAAATTPYSQHRSYTEHSSRSQLDETIPLEAALVHNRMDRSQGLSHSVSISSATSNFPRRNAKSGKRFEEKIQLQVIRYDVEDAHLVSPHGPTGRLVLGTYHIVSPPTSARCVKAQGGFSRGVARSGTVVVRRSRLDFPGQPGLKSDRTMSPLRELAEYSSMLLTDAENQHTFEAATLKWYMTEIHWKREAALLKHLKSPIFVMELMESYCIPPLQGRANTYPFVNAMGGRSSLLSDVGVVKTAQHARAILRAISGAVDWCHRHGVVHLNIQPGSFFLEDGIDPKAEDAPWKLWDFTCARFMGEPIGPVGGGGDPASRPVSRVISSPQPPPNHLSPDAYPYLDQASLQEQLDRIGGNPLPAAYTAPELLEAWRSGDTTFPVEAAMDSWSLGCVYYEILTGHSLFQTEADAWGLVGGWENKAPWTSKTFKVPYPPTPATQGSAVTDTTLVSSGPGPKSELTMEDDNTAPYERSMILDPSGSIAQLLQDMMKVQADERASLESIMERIY